MTTIRLFQYVAVLAIVLVAGCASSQSTLKESYSNVLVLAIADDYGSRAQYERSVASGLRRLGIAAVPYHEAVSSSGDISRERARALIDEKGFDAVLVTQVRHSDSKVDIQQDSAAVKVTRKNDRPVDFFRYDYEELDEPGEINLLAEASLDTDLHRATDGEIVWTYTWSSKSAENVGILIDESSSSLVRRMDRENVVGN